MNLEFFKLDGAGNDFVGVDWRGQGLPESGVLAAMARRLCDRHRGVGADGLLLIADGEHGAAFRLVYLNSDGSRAEMCGNGARCAAVLAARLGAASGAFTFLTDAGEYRASLVPGGATVAFPDIDALPHMTALEGPLRAVAEVPYLVAGVPHAVLMLEEDIELADVAQVGREIRHDPAFAPRGTNVNFCQWSGDRLLIRTYERGVEAETRACGTGAVAGACIALWSAGRTGVNRVILRTMDGEELTVGVNATPHGFASIMLTGPARIVFSGAIENPPTVAGRGMPSGEVSPGG